MITNKIKIIFIIVMTIFLFSFCHSNRSVVKFEDNITYDIYGKPIICSIIDSLHVDYCMTSGVHIIVSRNQVNYKYSRDSLNHYILQKYYESNEFDPYTEYNEFQYVYILFDGELNIVEVRFIKKATDIFPHKQEPYENIIIDEIRKTKGMWNSISKQSWYIFLYKQNIT